MNIFTFWEGAQPGYIKLCMDTWRFPFVVLNYDNLHNYTDLPIERIKQFTLPHIADCVRIHVLRDQGGYWLDADTIMLGDSLPETDLVGYPELRESSAGLLYSEPQSEMFKEWAAYQDEIINSTDIPTYWGTFVNSFSDAYIQQHKEVRIHPIETYWPETYMISGSMPRFLKYKQFYFEEQYSLSDIRRTDLLMLHNSWTPNWYKALSPKGVLSSGCTMSNILREVLCDT